MPVGGTILFSSMYDLHMKINSQIRRKTFIGAAITAAAALLPRLLARQRSHSDLQQVLNSEGLTLERAHELLAVCVPIGGIIPYVGDLNLPPNWQICDGSDLRPEASATLKARLGEKVPSMVGRVPRGVAVTDVIGVAIGTDNIMIEAMETLGAGAHIHKVDDHFHELPEHTGLVASQPANSVQPMALKNENDNWLRESHINRVDAGRVGDEGQHRHDLGGRTGVGKTANKDGIETNNVDNHAHEIPNFSIDSIPASITVVYIIRIF